MESRKFIHFLNLKACKLKKKILVDTLNKSMNLKSIICLFTENP